MKKLLTLFLLPISLFGCATATSSGVESAGKDLYTITVYMEGMKWAGEDNSGKTRTKAIKDASQHCRKTGKQASIVKENISRNEAGTAVIYFKCINK